MQKNLHALQKFQQGVQTFFKAILSREPPNEKQSLPDSSDGFHNGAYLGSTRLFSGIFVGILIAHTHTFVAEQHAAAHLVPGRSMNFRSTRGFQDFSSIAAAYTASRHQDEATCGLCIQLLYGSSPFECGCRLS